MPPKKREKEPELNKSSKLDYVQADHELFLQAFEKPTQIYRFLRTRNLLSPIFLNRTLSYMKQRMSRNNKSRLGFKTDSLLDRVIQKKRNEMEVNSLSGYMTLTFLGFYDKYLENSRDYQVKVETLLLKICHKKRKDSSSAIIEVSVGSCSVPLNPSNSEPPAMASAVSISSDTFSPSQGSNVKSYMLLLQVTLTPTQQANGIQTNSEIMNGDGDEPIQKRLKSSSLDQQFSQGLPLDKQTKFYGSELIVYDKHNRCLLTNGEYDLVMHDKPQQHKACITKSPHKALTAQWETISSETSVPGENNPFDIFKIRPVLKLKLSWSQEATNGLVNRPKTFQRGHDGLFTDKADTTSSNKENDRPGCNLNQKGSISDAGNATNANDLHASFDKQKLENQDDNENNENLQIIYQFLYNNNSRQQTETCDDLHCPWCSLDCGTLYSLLKHLKLCHSRFSFAYSPVTGGARIDVSVNDRYDGSYAGSPHDLLTCLASSGSRLAPRSGPARRAPVTRILACRPRSAQPRPHTMAEFVRETDEGDAAESQRPYISGHNRLYHHTITCLPVYPKELDIDSEGETDPLWLQQKTMMMIDEFTDVNEGEKELMKMWNLHVMKYNFVGDCQIPLACQMFLQDRGRELLQKNLYRNFILHMCSLHDFGLINPIAMHQTIQMLNQMLADNPEAKEAMKKRILLQSHHWIETGMHRQPTNIDTKPPLIQSKSSTFNVESSPSVRRKISNNRKNPQEVPIRRKSAGNVAANVTGHFRNGSMMAERKSTA